MKFERKHQQIKAFTNSTNFLNVSKSIAMKYLAHLELINCKAFEYVNHPLTKKQTGAVVNSKGISKLVKNGITIKNDKSTVIRALNGELFKLIDILNAEAPYIVAKKIKVNGFSNELLAYELAEIDENEVQVSVDAINFEVGHIYQFCGDNYCFFNKPKLC